MFLAGGSSVGSVFRVVACALPRRKAGARGAGSGANANRAAWRLLFANGNTDL